MLGGYVEGTVLSNEVKWEPGRGIVAEALLGRRVLFLARRRGSSARDLYRARVRLSAEGQPIEPAGLRNLTDTPLGDESGLEVEGPNAVFATTAFGRVQGITVLDLRGVTPGDRPASLADRALLALTSLRRTGSLAGIGRTEVALDSPARAATFQLEPSRLSIETTDPTASASMDLDTAELRADQASQGILRSARTDYRGRSTISWAVDWVRDLIGPTPVAWIENRVFAMRDLGQRATSALVGGSRSRLKPRLTPPVAYVLRPSEEVGIHTGWPPPPIPSLWETPQAGEGQWSSVRYSFLPTLASESGKAPPPYFFTTFIRPDPERPYTEVLLVAMDMRQLELGMEGGYEEPQPAVGPPGTGRIPRNTIMSRVVAAFNGAFKAEHGAYGMMVDGRILLPPVPGAATVMVMRDGDARFGTWPVSAEVPREVVSFRQNLDPLVDGTAVNPAGRHIWGWQVAGESSLTERTAMCLTPAGHVYYAWGRDISGSGLARALKQAGCDFAIHLDMNPRHCGFVFMHANPTDWKNGSYRLADSGMNINPSRYVLGSDKDFFYVMLRNQNPSDPSGLNWQKSEGAQPSPTWIPSIFRATRRLGELEIELVAFDPGRVDWLVRAGSDEPSASGARPKKIGLEAGLEGRVVAAVGLGHTTDALRYGLVFDGQASLDLRQTYATVVLAPSRAPRILSPGERPALVAGEDAVQLPLLADRGIIDPRASDRGGTRERGALCVTDAGRVLVALGRHDSSDPLASTLISEGCARVVGLDRGSRHPAFVNRAETQNSPLDRYDESVLYAVARPMTPHASRFEN